MKHSLIKEHIIKTAANLFYQNGYNLTGINEIIKEAGIAKATLYNHFQSKEAICIAYLRYKNDAFLIDLKDFVSSKPNGKSKLIALFEYLEGFYNSNDFNGCWCINTISEIPKENTSIRLEIQQQKNTLIHYIIELVKENIENLSIDETEQLAKQIYLLYESAVSESYLQQEVWPIFSAKTICDKLI